MANLTITVDDEELRRARMRALEQGTSVNALLREYLAAYAGAREAQARTTQRVLEIARRSGAGSGGSRWTREELHERG